MSRREIVGIFGYRATVGDLLVTVVHASAQPTPPSTAESPDLLSFLVKQTALARERVARASYSVQWESEKISPDGKTDRESMRATVYRDGLNMCSVFDTDGYVISKKEPERGSPVRNTYRLVVNNQYVAMWPVANPLAYVYDHPSPDRISDEAKDVVEIASMRDVLRYGFGDGDSSLQDVMRQLSRETRWEVTERRDTHGHAIYMVQAFAPHSDPGLRASREYEIDVEQGFLITRFIIRTSSGELGVERTVSGGQFGADQVWFPQEIVDLHYAAWGHSGGGGAGGDKNRVTSKSIIKLTDIHVNEPLPKERFEIAALGIPADVLVMRTEVSGRTKQWRVRDSKLIPAEVVDSFDRQAPNSTSQVPIVPPTVQATSEGWRSGEQAVTSFPNRLPWVWATAALSLLLVLFFWYAKRRRVNR